MVAAQTCRIKNAIVSYVAILLQSITEFEYKSLLKQYNEIIDVYKKKETNISPDLEELIKLAWNENVLQEKFLASNLPESVP